MRDRLILTPPKKPVLLVEAHLYIQDAWSVHPHTHENLDTDLLKTVEAALKECAGIPVKDFGLVVTLENGEERTFSSTSLAPYRQRFFTGEFYSHFRRAVRKASDDAYSTPGKTHTC